MGIFDANQPSLERIIAACEQMGESGTIINAKTLVTICKENLKGRALHGAVTSGSPGETRNLFKEYEEAVDKTECALITGKTQ
jgi:hypothetical protein